jgi:hypothetical protein
MSCSLLGCASEVGHLFENGVGHFPENKVGIFLENIGLMVGHIPENSHIAVYEHIFESYYGPKQSVYEKVG